ncbi:MAG: Rrf2 family transcriptional regulator [Bacteroidetes bacterium]|jgi:Rrf2 family protein|nr:Rrf2 family transcriptional regulator [Bacteroidota bacterium]
MFQLSKKVEYGLIALRHMAMHPMGQVFTAKELAREYDVPYELLAKVLQKLARAGIVHSTQGVRGGYALGSDPRAMTVATVIQIIEEEKPMIAECYVEGPDSCSIFDSCTIRKPLGKVQRDLNILFDKMTIHQII